MTSLLPWVLLPFAVYSQAAVFLEVLDRVVQRKICAIEHGSFDGEVLDDGLR